MKEFKLIERLLGNIVPVPDGVVGAGDDCAVIPKEDGSFLLITTDSMVEDVHFRRSYFSGEDLGWKLVSVNVSDVAAMMGEPEFAVINLQLPKGIEAAYLDSIYKGINQACEHYGLSLVGGDTVSSKTLSLSLTVVGKTNTPAYRSGCQVGDDLWLTGEVGLAGLGLEILEGRTVDSSKKAEAAHLRPLACLDFVRNLKSQSIQPSAMIDISDGFLQDLAHISNASSCSFELEEEVPRVLGYEKALSSGEDYQLLFTASSKLRPELESLKSNHTYLTRIGIAREKEQTSGILAKDAVGYQHNF